MKRAAIYARFSTELQSDRSIEDQVALCREFAKRSNFQVVGLYDDRARSGASMLGRTGLMDLLSDAREHAFDVVVVEALDRISRDQEDLAGIFKRLSFGGIEIVAVHDGKADIVQVGIRGLVGALYLSDLAHKVRRGMAGVVRDGRHAGGRAYGYRPVPGKPGEMEIVEEEAAIVRRIFEERAAGDVARTIAARLNDERVAPPRGQFWRGGTISGNHKRANGILNNEVYRGQLVWNRVRMVKAPDTGKRVSRENPESEWQRVEAPHLRIVSDELWQAAHGKMRYTATPHKRKTKRLLTGLLRCGCCGAGMSMKDIHRGTIRIMCSQAKEAGACTNRRAYDLLDIESRVVRNLREQLGSREAIELYVRAYNDEIVRGTSEAAAARARAEVLLNDAQRALDRTVEGLVRGRISEEEADRLLPDLRKERDRLKAEVAALDEPPKLVTLHPAAVDAYLAKVDRLAAALAGDPGSMIEHVEAVRALVETVVVEPAPTGVTPDLTITGFLARLCGNWAFPQCTLRGGSSGSGGGTRTPDTRIMIPLL